MRVKTDRLLLRTLDPEDVPALRDFHLRNRVFLQPWEPERNEAFYEAASFDATIAADLADRAAGRSLKLYLFEKADDCGPIVGYAGLSNIVYGTFLSCFLGYKVDEAARGNGYMTEALCKLVAIAFGELGLHRIEANIMPRNAASIRLVGRLGFELEGRSPRYLRIAGAWEDHEHYVLRNAALE